MQRLMLPRPRLLRTLQVQSRYRSRISPSRLIPQRLTTVARARMMRWRIARHGRNPWQANRSFSGLWSARTVLRRQMRRARTNTLLPKKRKSRLAADGGNGLLAVNSLTSRDLTNSGLPVSVSSSDLTPAGRHDARKSHRNGTPAARIDSRRCHISAADRLRSQFPRFAQMRRFSKNYLFQATGWDALP